jgi:hypothetical protein
MHPTKSAYAELQSGGVYRPCVVARAATKLLRLPARVIVELLPLGLDEVGRCMLTPT